MQQKLRYRYLPIFVLITITVSPGVAWSQVHQVEGFSSPYQTLNIGAPEPGVVQQLRVREGDSVTKGQILVVLDLDIHLALEAIARKSMEATGQLTAASAELHMHDRRLETILQLREEGHTQEDEVLRARAERDIAHGRLLAAQEQGLLKKLEHDKIKAQIERRQVRAPIDGIVAQIDKHAGELVTSNEPQLLVLVELDRLMAEFAVDRRYARQFKAGSPVTVQFIDEIGSVDGVVDFISPLTDAESGTVLVKVRIENQGGRYHSGERCELAIPTTNVPGESY